MPEYVTAEQLHEHARLIQHAIDALGDVPSLEELRDRARESGQTVHAAALSARAYNVKRAEEGLQEAQAVLQGLRDLTMPEEAPF